MLVCVRFKITFKALNLYCNIYYHIFDHKNILVKLDFGIF
jgi:hypothetical protein